MTVFTATSSGLSAAASGAANLAACKSLAASAISGDVLEVDGFFKISSSFNPVIWPNNFTVRAATPGATNQGFDVVDTLNATDNWAAMAGGTGFVMQGVTVTASEAPAYNPDFNNNNPSSSQYHRGAFLTIGSNSVIEFCDIRGTIRYLIDIDTGASNVSIRDSIISGAYYSVHFDKLLNSAFERCYLFGALVDNIKCNQGANPGSDNVTFRNLFIDKGRDAIDLAGNWTDFLIEDCTFMNSRVTAIDAKTSALWADSYNQGLTVNRVRFVNCRHGVSTDMLDAGSLSLADYIAGMPRDFTFADCSYETTTGFESRYNYWLLKGGDYFTILRPKYYGPTRQGFRIYITQAPPSFTPTNLIDGDATKEVYAERAIPTMDLVVGPENWAGSGPIIVPSAFTAPMWTLTDPVTDGDLAINIGSLPVDNGSAITDLEAKVDAGAWTSLAGTTATTYTLSGLTNGVTYSVMIRARNANGTGADSDSKSRSPTAAAAAPDAYTSGMWALNNPATDGDLQVTISQTPADNGATLTAIQYSLNAGGSWTSFAGTGTGTYTISGLANGTPYDVIIRAVNAIDAGASSDIKTETPTVASGIPVNVTLPAITGSGVFGTLHTVSTGTWTNSPTSFSYGANIDDAFHQSGNSYTPTADDIGKLLTFGVRATNAAGNSVWVDTEPLVITTAVVGTPTLPASSIPITATVV